MYVLGISCFYHDSAACLIKDGLVVAAAEEERFTRIKHDTSFPKKAIEFCLDYGGITIEDIEGIGFYEKPFLKFERILDQHLEMFPLSYKTFIKSLPSWINTKLRLVSQVKKKLKYKGDIYFMEHHMAHAAAAFLPSPFKKAAILTVDGVGEWTTTAYGIGDGTNIHLDKEIRFPDSLGLLYSTITAYLGFRVNNSEYKVMGLAPYGIMDRKTNEYYPLLQKVIDIKDDGSYKFDMSYFVFHYSDHMPSKKMMKLLGGPIRTGEVEKKHMDIAAALQMLTEDVMQKLLNHVYRETKLKDVVIAGGVALNSVSNGKLLRNTPFKRIWVQPNATDGGSAMGAAYYVYNTILNNPRAKPLGDAYLGPEFTDDQVQAFLDNNKIKYSKFKNDKDMIEHTAKIIFDNNVIGWFQGRMEWGPRALGARSILSNAANTEMQNILNLKVKHREKFRPFAPSVCEDDALKYFECDTPIPQPTDYMLMVYPIKKIYHSKIPAVTHVDGSGRLQTVRRKQNPKYYDLLKEFGKLSKIPILINTSFNIRGEPIVCTPYDAYKCMMGTGIDYLVMGSFLIKRDDNPQDMWDSEKYAKD